MEKIGKQFKDWEFATQMQLVYVLNVIAISVKDVIN